MTRVFFDHFNVGRLFAMSTSDKKLGDTSSAFRPDPSILYRDIRGSTASLRPINKPSFQKFEIQSWTSHHFFFCNKFARRRISRNICKTMSPQEAENNVG